MQKDALILPSPAKINLMLNIIGRREAGYHELQTLFQFLDYGDEITLSVRDDGVICLHTSFPKVPHDSNLIVKAARKLQEQSGCPLGIHIWIKKVLPMGGGIGGGSSNAATTLLGLNHLWHLDWNADRLAALGLGLGADIPVFVRGYAAFAEGIGEILTPAAPEEPWYLVLVPQVSVSTAEIFSDPLLTRDSSPARLEAIQERGSPNDCEAVVRHRYPAVASALDSLDRYTRARLTGTGSCVYGIFPNEADANEVLNLLSRTLSGFVAKGANTSMLHRKLKGIAAKADTRS
jgi:4-diphosphocytidyl-2-C-methyl-D-erythritol kinase